VNDSGPYWKRSPFVPSRNTGLMVVGTAGAALRRDISRSGEAIATMTAGQRANPGHRHHRNQYDHCSAACGREGRTPAAREPNLSSFVMEVATTAAEPKADAQGRLSGT
jgi:hypothetical protein